MQDEHLDVLPNGSHLSFGSYQEESRPLRRVLKQVGGGSVGGGLLAVQQDQNALRELASALCIDAKVALCLCRASSGVLCCTSVPLSHRLPVHTRRHVRLDNAVLHICTLKQSSGGACGLAHIYAEGGR